MSPPPMCIAKPASHRITRTTMMSQSKFPMRLSNSYSRASQTQVVEIVILSACEGMCVSVAREGALDKLSPALGAGKTDVAEFRGRGGGHSKVLGTARDFCSSRL